MASTTEMRRQIEQGEWDAVFRQLYGAQRVLKQRQRYSEALHQFDLYYGEAQDVRVYSVPGRTEICGNNTDHQKGVALAAAVDRDILAIAARRDRNIVRVKSYGFDKLDVVDLQLHDRQNAENTHSASLIRGIGYEIAQRGGVIGGFDAYTTSDVLRGSGLSSSAAFEVAMGIIWNDLYNNNRLSPLAVAQAGQFSENKYFGKPCGLLDALTCSMGGVICVDLKREEAPSIQMLDHLITPEDMVMCITDTRGSHSELTDVFSLVRTEMEDVARAMGCENLRQGSEEKLLADMPRLRRLCGDRAVLRALHFYRESDRALRACRALSTCDYDAFFQCIRDSGHSASQYNQNASCDTDLQAIPLALAVSQSVLGNRGACRLQGTGFAGTIQAFVPQELLAEYMHRMEQVFGAGCCMVMHIRHQGGIRLNPSVR